MNYVFCLLFVLFSFLACSEKTEIQHQEKTSKPTDIYKKYNNDFIKKNYIETSTGISTNSNILVKNGYLEILLEAGIFKSSDGKPIQILKEKELNGKIVLSDLVTNEALSGAIEVTNENNLKYFPEVPFNPNVIYQLSFNEADTTNRVSEKIFIAGANYCNPESYFSKVPLLSLANGEIANLKIKENTYKDTSLGNVAVIGWDHQTSQSFYLRIENRTKGAKYKIVAALGSYSIAGHECELYLQRDVNSPFPTWVDSNYADKVTKVTQEDTSLRQPITNEFYSFSKTFIIIKAYNSASVDVTGADNGVLSLEQTDSLYGLPVSFDSEEESSLLAYLNKGNNNSYSMVLGGLIVGIFGFFLSRKLFQRIDS